MTRRFDVTDTPLAGLTFIRREPVRDARGYLERLFCEDELSPWLHGERVAQVNRTLTRRRGTVRGMHFQRPPHAETKIVSCLRGRVFDVAVDLRKGSPTFLEWHAEVLDADEHTMLLIPKGFAHGFQTLTDDCELLYVHTAAYEPSAEGALNARDPRLAIRWPEAIADLSERDAAHPMLGAAFHGIDA